MQNWEILRADGRYIGCSEADRPEIAFCQYMVVCGKSLSTHDVRAKKNDDGAVSIEYEGETYVLKSRSQDRVDDPSESLVQHQAA